VLGTLDTEEMTVAENDGTPFARRPEPGEEAR